ncbi:MAG TPA: epoxyqueuosine reductase [Methanofollis liminatans]|uniref:Epoxyqueuosine reductase n=1 Tax=Methanofollis liminatans TaxID=2201 RepID=A0A831PPS6_9EURY|nr:epoxyqueuosine reductase [Methanofollis liminatans]
MSGDLKAALIERCRAMEIPLVGVADVGRWEHPPFQPWMPEAFFPHSIVPGARSVIVIGLPIHLPVIETTPSIWYHELYRTVNTLLDGYTYRIAGFLNEQGHPSVSVPRDGYGGIDVLLERPIAFFSHRHAALLAGLGTFGVNNMLLTQKYGPRVRFGSVITTAALPPDPLIEEDLCTRCMACVQMCPVRALGGEDYPEGLTDKRACAENSAGLNKRSLSPCGICVKVCPVGEDIDLYGRRDAGGLERAAGHVRSYGSR